MNREIKFRAWTDNLKDDGEMYYGYFDNNFNILFSPAGYGIGNSSLKIMQFTGLKDKNGKEIYEGDILKDEVGDILEVKFGKLPLNKGGDCICGYEAFYCKCYGQLGKSPMYECENIGDWMEVIGNIYENPELLTPHST